MLPILMQAFGSDYTQQPFNVILSSYSDEGMLDHWNMSDYMTSLGYALGKCATGDRGPPITSDEDSGMFRHSPECDTSRTESLYFHYVWKPSENTTQDAVFIAAALVIPGKNGDRVIDNGFDLGRDAFVSRATLNNTGGPIASFANTVSKSSNIEFRTSVMHNDTSLLANVSKQNFANNVSTDGRIPILVIHRSNVAGNEAPRHFPTPNATSAADASHHGGQAGMTYYLPTTQLVVLASIIALAPMAFST